MNGEQGKRLGTAPVGTRSGGRKTGGGNPSSSKEVLIKLKKHHPLPGVVLDWRKLNMAISKVTFWCYNSKKKANNLFYVCLNRLCFRCNAAAPPTLGWAWTGSTPAATPSPPPGGYPYTSRTYKTFPGMFFKQ